MNSASALSARSAAAALNGLLKDQLTGHQGPWRNFDEVERTVLQRVVRHNSERLHPALGYMPPDEYEQVCWVRLEQVPQTG